MSEECIKDMLLKIAAGWKLLEASWVRSDSEWSYGEYARTEEDCMTEACGGDERLGRLLSLFSHWSNDLADLALEYGVDMHPEEEGAIE